MAASQTCPEADKLGLYALIGSRWPDGGRAEVYLRNSQHWTGSQRRLVDGHPWRQALSITYTFGARVGTQVENLELMLYAMRFGGGHDHAGCLMYQEYSPYSLRFLKTLFLDRNSGGLLRRSDILGRRAWLNVYSAFRMRRGARARILVAPDPALITHLETASMAAGTDWSVVAQQTREWISHQQQSSAAPQA